VWHLIGLKSRVLILLREGLVSVEDKGVTDARLVSVDVKGLSSESRESTVESLKREANGGGVCEGMVWSRWCGHRPFFGHCTVIHE